MFVKSQIKSKSVGNVRIFEIMGNFSGDFVYQAESAMKKVLRNNLRKNVLFNAADMSTIDETGVAAILNQTVLMNKCVLLSPDEEVRNRFQTRDVAHRMLCIGDPIDATYALADELAASPLDGMYEAEKRRHIRLGTVLPLEFVFETQKGKPEEGYAVVTNLSEGGLYAEFINSRVEDEMRRSIDPYDLKFLQIKLFLENDLVIDGRGKLVHGHFSDGGFGLEFYGFAPEIQGIVREWIEKHVTAKAMIARNKNLKNGGNAFRGEGSGGRNQ
ncbi:MAG: hypothetical protein ACOY3K_05575 [Candidatus Omnitrophota bacterium]